jgi:hypothetical protein
LVFGIIFYFTRPFINRLIEKVRFNSFENNVARLVKQGEAYHKMKELRNEMKSDVMFNLKDESTLREVIYTLSSITNKPVSKEKEDKIINTILQNKVPSSIDKMF